MTSDALKLELVVTKEGSYLRATAGQLCPTCGVTIDDADTIACQVEGGEKCIIDTLIRAVGKTK
jgi:hypothetical protein